MTSYRILAQRIARVSELMAQPGNKAKASVLAGPRPEALALLRRREPRVALDLE